jgi:hypothetical protein
MRVIVTVQVGGSLGGPSGSAQAKAPRVCNWLVVGNVAGGGCSPEHELFTRWPFTAGEFVAIGGDQYATIDALASDEVARLELFMATGEAFPSRSVTTPSSSRPHGPSIRRASSPTTGRGA